MTHITAPLVPTDAMLRAADAVIIPPFYFPREWPQDVVDEFAADGWVGLTRGEYNDKRFTLIYQAMIGAIE